MGAVYIQAERRGSRKMSLVRRHPPAERGTFFASHRLAAASLSNRKETLPMTTGIGIDKASELTPRDFERLLLRTLNAMKKGDFKVRMPVEFTGTQGKIADTLNP